MTHRAGRYNPAERIKEWLHLSLIRKANGIRFMMPLTKLFILSVPMHTRPSQLSTMKPPNISVNTAKNIESDTRKNKTKKPPTLAAFFFENMRKSESFHSFAYWTCDIIILEKRCGSLAHDGRAFFIRKAILFPSSGPAGFFIFLPGIFMCSFRQSRKKP